ncbi:MAG TPA: hypothetical protein VK463_21025 [Desulfomonilaceae bacterium]|nr:hypothetical protein [Desulfomonilaceae bacterium]
MPGSDAGCHQLSRMRQLIGKKPLQPCPFIRIRFFTGNSILGAGWGHSFAADDAEPSHHFAQESPQPCNLTNLIANTYLIVGKRLSLRA